MSLRINRSWLFWGLILAAMLAGSDYRTKLQPDQTLPSLRLNEIAAAPTGLTDEDGDLADWIELHNAGSLPVNLSAWALTDDPHQPAKWTFPDRTLPPAAYLVVFASGKNRRPAEPGAPLHTNFRLQRDGEFLGLFNVLDGQFADQVTAVHHLPEVSYGRSPESAFVYLSTATPGQANPAAVRWQGLVADVRPSLERGFYDAPFWLTLTTDNQAAVIRYTLDGSEPTATHGQYYTLPIPIERTTLVRAAAFQPGFHPSTVTSHSYIFLDDVLSQPAAPPGWPATWGVYHETYKHAVEGEPAPADYEMDPEIVHDPAYRDRLKADLQAMPSLSLVMPQASFDELYSHPRERGPAWERAVSVEFFDPRQPEAGFQINAGLRIQGDLGRQEYIPKHSFRLFFRSQYGAPKLRYPLFPNSPVDEFETLILRGGVQSSYVSVWQPRRQATTYARDEWLRASQIDMSGYGAHGTFVHLYLNGLYWGLYNVVERPDENFAAAYFGVKKDDWYAFNHSGVVNGDPKEAQARFASFLKAGSPDAQYAALGELLEMTDFVDYVILNWYAGTNDWANNNWYAGIPHTGGKLRFFVWDGELTWVDGADIDFGLSNPPGYLWPNTVEVLFNALNHHPDFQMLLADRLYHHLYHGALTGAQAQARWLKLNRQIEAAIRGEIARWGDSRQEPPLNHRDWQQAVEAVRHQMAGNGQELIREARALGYYPPFDPPEFKVDGSSQRLELYLAPTTLHSPEVVSYYTLDGSDPRLPGGEIAPTAQIYTKPLTLTGPAEIKARAFQAGTWSALQQATLSPTVAVHPLQFTELMYNPPGPDETEYIELKNIGAEPVALAGLTFAGVRFTFPAGSPPLGPGEYAVLVRNELAFAQRYPETPIAGVYEGQLSNNGERLALLDAAGQVLTAVEYQTRNGWPISPDGRGDSLARVDFNGDPSQPRAWQASQTVGGSPGQAEPAFEFTNSLY